MTKYRLLENETKHITLDRSGRYQVLLTKSGSQAHIKGAFHIQGRSRLDISLEIIHTAPHTQATTTLHAAAADQSQVSLKGKIIVKKNCPDTNSFLVERVLLLSDQATANVLPDLEIQSDDVKCSHAASISRLSQDQLFYLQTRGLTPTKAQNLIVSGFLSL